MSYLSKKYGVSQVTNLTIQDVMRLFVYNPYSERMCVMVDDNQRIHIKTNQWIAILDHNTGDFFFSGELHKYYEIDTISSIRDSFGEMYSVFNIIYDSIPVDTWVEVDFDGLFDCDEEQRKERKEKEKEKLRQYYYDHRDEIRRSQRKYQRWKKQMKEEQT